MKAILKSFALALVVSLVACKKDDDDTSSNPSGDLKSNIVGNWEVTALEQRNGEMSMSGQSIGTFTGTGRDFQGEMIFNADGSATGNIGYVMDMAMTISMPGLPAQTINQSQTIPQTPSSGTYEVTSDNKLKTSAVNGSEVTFDVLSHSASTLELQANMDSTMSQQGMNMNTEFDLYISFKKK